MATRERGHYADPVGTLLSEARRASLEWGTTAAEREQPFPCDGLALDADAVLFRGVSVKASPATVYRWLCQLRVAPYSYDWIDNFGRRSPPYLITGVEQLSRGQSFMSIFALVDFQPGRHVTLRIKKASAAERLFGDIRGTYLVTPSDDGCRLVVKLLATYPPGLVGLAGRYLLPWGDLVMMRRQLLNLKRLAEHGPDPHEEAMAGPGVVRRAR